MFAYFLFGVGHHILKDNNGKAYLAEGLTINSWSPVGEAMNSSQQKSDKDNSLRLCQHEGWDLSIFAFL